MSISIILGPFTIICLIIGFAFISCGWLLRKYPPKKINQWYGYRTPSSRMSQERWDFAQKYSASSAIRTGLIFILIGFIGLFIEVPNDKSVWLALVTLVFGVTFLILRVESAIKKKFSNR